MRVIVVGAGVLGASLACHLSRAGVSVVVIDADRAGRATQAGAGIVCPWLSDVGDQVFASLYESGARYYHELVTVLGDADAIGYRRPGALFVTRDVDELEGVAHRAQAKAARIPEMGDVDRLSPREARALFPPLAPDFAALRVSGGARVDGRRLAATLLDDARRSGAEIIHGTAKLVFKGQRVLGVQMTTGDFIPADIVAATNGAWGPALLAPLGITLPVEPQKGQILHLDLPGQDTRDWPVILPPGSYYLLAFDGGRIVAGATRETGAGFDHRVTAGGQAALLEQALNVAPGLRHATLMETRIGFRPTAPGVRPLLGWVQGIDGLIVGNGLGAGGLTIGPYAGKLLADTILGQPSVDLAPFNPLASQRQHGPALR